MISKDLSLSLPVLSTLSIPPSLFILSSKELGREVGGKEDVGIREEGGGGNKSLKRIRSRWAWIRLALHQLGSGEWSEAENSFQQALRINPKDGYIWQGLGETYRRSGKFLGTLPFLFSSFSSPCLFSVRLTFFFCCCNSAAKKALLRAVECLPPPAPYLSCAND
jgi:hypothetical protein